jgi:hypothetical protein
MTVSLYFAAGFVTVLVIWCIWAFVRGVQRELNHTDDWWTPSESGRLAKERYDSKIADKEQKTFLRRINKPKYQQPLNQPTENS